MSKRALAKTLRKEYGFSWREAKNVLQTILLSIKKDLLAGNKIILHGFGTFSITKHSTRKYRDIHTGRITIRAGKNKVKFKPSKKILET